MDSSDLSLVLCTLNNCFLCSFNNSSFSVFIILCKTVKDFIFFCCIWLCYIILFVVAVSTAVSFLCCIRSSGRNRSTSHRIGIWNISISILFIITVRIVLFLCGVKKGICENWFWIGMCKLFPSFNITICIYSSRMTTLMSKYALQV